MLVNSFALVGKWGVMIKRRMEGRKIGTASKKRPEAGVQLGAHNGWGSDVCISDVGVL